MPDSNLPIRATQIPTGVGNAAATMEQLHPPIIAFSNTAAAAVFANSGQADGVHSVCKAPTMSAVAGIHDAGGNGIFGSSSGNAGFFQGNVQVTGNLNVSGDIFLPGADLAEHFEIAAGATLDPGMLAAIDETGALRPSGRPYERALAGVIAGAGSFRPAVLLDSDCTRQQPRVRLSLAGKVFCRANTSNGSIAVGDLLTSSATPGCAMRATDSARAFGAVVGKALKPLAEGSGLIPILVTLQ